VIASGSIPSVRALGSSERTSIEALPRTAKPAKIVRKPAIASASMVSPSSAQPPSVETTGTT